MSTAIFPGRETTQVLFVKTHVVFVGESLHVFLFDSESAGLNEELFDLERWRELAMKHEELALSEIVKADQGLFQTVQLTLRGDKERHIGLSDRLQCTAMLQEIERRQPGLKRLPAAVSKAAWLLSVLTVGGMLMSFSVIFAVSSEPLRVVGFLGPFVALVVYLRAREHHRARNRVILTRA